MAFDLILACAIVTLIVGIWCFVRLDLDLNFKFWTFFGPTEDTFLRGKVAFITGAGSGMGKALAFRWASKGVRLALNDLKPGPLEEVKASCLRLGLLDKDVLLLPGDVADFKTHDSWVKAIVGQFDHLDILVNNAGFAVQGPCSQVPFPMDRQIFDVLALAPIALAKAVLPHFLRRGTGHIVQISSCMAHIPSPSIASYGATKAAVRSYFQAMRAELWLQDISVTIVCPGPVRTSVIRNSKITKGEQRPLLHKTNDWPIIFNQMGKRRAAELISLATVNKMGEVWISTQPVMIITKLCSLFPEISTWVCATAVVPLMHRFLLTTKSTPESEKSPALFDKIQQKKEQQDGVGVTSDSPARNAVE